MEESAKETVIIVHGTWAAPEPGVMRWYQPGDGATAAGEFVTKLDVALQKRGSPARCWAHCTQAHQIFHWSGENSWIARTRAAWALADYVAKFQNDGWRCHIVAHSHGGNVVVEALQQIITPPTPSTPLGKLVTLGTPFFDTISPIRKNAQRLVKVMQTLSGVGMVLPFAVLGVSFFFFEFSKTSLEPLELGQQRLLVFGVVSLLAAGGGLLFILRNLVLIPWFSRRRTRDQENVFQTPRMQKPMSLRDEVFHFLLAVPWKPTLQTSQIKTRLLVIGSPMDEAWQVLHHLGAIDNPLAIRSSALSYLFSSLRSQVSRSGEIAHIQGAKSYADVGMLAKLVLGFLHVINFTVLCAYLGTILVILFAFYGGESIDWLLVGGILVLVGVVYPTLMVMMAAQVTRWFGPNFFAAFLSPFRWCFRLLSAVSSIPFHCTTYIVRRKGWSVLLKMAMGLEGYRFTMPSVEQLPRNIPANFVKHENMPTTAEKHALVRRSAWVAGHLGDVSQTFSKLVVSAADIQSLLRTIEEDQTLVHAAYYTDDECIARIADCIAGSSCKRSAGSESNNSR